MGQLSGTIVAATNSLKKKNNKINLACRVKWYVCRKLEYCSISSQLFVFGMKDQGIRKSFNCNFQNKFISNDKYCKIKILLHFSYSIETPQNL